MEKNYIINKSMETYINKKKKISLPMNFISYSNSFLIGPLDLWIFVLVSNLGDYK